MQKRRFLILVFAVSLFAFFLVIQLQKSGTPETPAVSAFSFSDDFSLQRGVHTVAVPRIATFTDRSVPHTLVAAQEALEKKYPAHFLSAGTRETTSRQLVAAEPASDGGTLQEPLGEIMEGWYATGPLDEYVKYSPSSFTQEQDGSGSQMVSAQKAGVGITRHFEGLDPNKYYQAKAWVYVVQGGVKLSAGKDGIPLSSTEGKWQLLTTAAFTGEDTIDLSFSTYMPDTAAFIDNTTIYEVPAPVIPKEPEGDTLQQEGEGVTMEDDCPDCGTPEDLQNLAKYYYYQSHPNGLNQGESQSEYKTPEEFTYTQIRPILFLDVENYSNSSFLVNRINNNIASVRNIYSNQIPGFQFFVLPIEIVHSGFDMSQCILDHGGDQNVCNQLFVDATIDWTINNNSPAVLNVIYAFSTFENGAFYLGINTVAMFTSPSSTDSDMTWVTSHETGHAMGLIHSHPPSLMGGDSSASELFDTTYYPEKYVACNSSLNAGLRNCDSYIHPPTSVSTNVMLKVNFTCDQENSTHVLPENATYRMVTRDSYSNNIIQDTVSGTYIGIDPTKISFITTGRVYLDGSLTRFHIPSSSDYSNHEYIFVSRENGNIDICEVYGTNCQTVRQGVGTNFNDYLYVTLKEIPSIYCNAPTPTNVITSTPVPTRTPTPTNYSTPVPTRTPTPPPGCIPTGQCKTSSGTCCSGFSNPAPECTSSSGNPYRCAAAPTNTPTPTSVATRTPTPTQRPPTPTPTSVTNVVCTQNYGSTASCVGQSQCFSYGDYWHFSDPNNHYCTEWGAGDGCCHCRTGNRTTEGNMSGQVINNMCDWRCNPGSCQPPPTTCSGGTISNVSIGNGILYGSGAPPANSLQLSWNWQKTSGVDPVRFKISRYMDLFNSCDVNMSCSATTQNSIDFATVNFNGNSYAYTDSIGLPAKMGVLNSYHVKAEYPSGTQVCGDIPPSGNLQLSNKQFTNPHGTVVVDPNNRCRIYGWTRDQDADLIAGVKQQLIVHFYEGQSYLGGAVATVNRDQYLWGYDVNMGDIKPSLRDGQDHQIYVWALNVKQPNYTFTTAGVNSKLNATAVTIRCPVQQSPTPTPTLIPVSCANPNITPSASLPVGGNIVYQSTSHTVGWTPIIKYKTIPNPQTTPTAPFNTCSGGLPCTYTPVAQVGEYVFSGVNLQKNIGGITYICSWSGQWSPSAPPGYSTCTNTCGRSLPVGSAPTATNTPTRTPTPTLINVSCTNPSTIPAAVLTPGQSITYQSAQYTNGWTPSVKYQRLPAGILTPTPTLGWQTCPSITPGVGIPCRYTPNITPGKNYIHVVNLQKTISVTPYVCGWNNTWSPQTPPGYGACTNNCEKVVQTNP